VFWRTDVVGQVVLIAWIVIATLLACRYYRTW
jgi:hypothetical protein